MPTTWLMLQSQLLLTALLLLLLSPPANCASDDAAASSLPEDRGPQPSLEVFSFDYTWTPARPVPNDTVVFQAIAEPSVVARWGLTDSSFRWYQQQPQQPQQPQKPGSDFLLRHVGRTYTRRADEAHFEGRYRLRVSVERPKPPQQQPPAWDSEMLVDVVKYVGLQKRVDIGLLSNRTGNSSSSSSSHQHRIVCRFWGWPLLDTLLFQPAPGSVCDRRHFETSETEPHIDLVIGCTGRLQPGTYSCYGRNVVSAGQLSCELSGPDLAEARCYRPSLQDEEEAEAGAAASAEGVASSGPGPAKAEAPEAEPRQRQAAAAAAAPVASSSGTLELPGSLAVVMATACLATVCCS